MKKAVLLFSMGGPRSLKDVRAFLFHLFNDPAILRIPQPFRFILAQLISLRRTKTAKNIYKKLGGCSPLLENTQKQAEALEKELQKVGEYHCYVGMSYTKPFIKEMIRALEKEEPEKVILLPLYPQYSTTTTASVLKEATKALRKWKKKPEIVDIQEFYQDPGFIEAIVELIRPYYEEAIHYGVPKLLFSAHGLPEKIVEKGDPYQKQCEKTASLLVQSLGIKGLDWSLCYQSRVGPMKWIGPGTDEFIDVISREGRPLVVVPIAFVSEHSETLVEIGMDYRERALRLGCPSFSSVPTVQVHPFFIQGLAALVNRR